MATPIQMPKQGQSVETCVINEWMKKKGDQVKQGEVLLTYETDKASFELESPASGTLLATFYNAQDDVPVLSNVGAIGNPGEDAEQFRPAGSASAAAPSPKTPEPAVAADVPVASAPVQGAASSPAVSGEVRISPRARMKAEERRVDPAMVTGTGPGGRVIERDIIAARDAGPAAPSVAGISAGDLVKKALIGAPAPMEDVITEVKLANIRKIIGQRMHQSLQQSAQLTMNMSADATAMLEYRKKVKARGKDLGLPDITVTDLIALAVAKTLPQFPDLNCLYKDDKLYQYRHVHLAMAVDTPRGLMVPVIRFADRFGLAEISQMLKSLAQQCKEGSISPDLLNGGTITISNLGMFGVETFTPILNPPQVAIVGVCGTAPKAVANDKGGYDIRPHVGISLTIDHRVVDGAPGARFLKALCDNIANIDFMLSVW